MSSFGDNVSRAIPRGAVPTKQIFPHQSTFSICWCRAARRGSNTGCCSCILGFFIINFALSCKDTLRSSSI